MPKKQNPRFGVTAILPQDFYVQLLLVKKCRQTAQALDGRDPTPSSFIVSSGKKTQKSTPSNPEKNQILKPGRSMLYEPSKILTARCGPSPQTHRSGDLTSPNHALHPAGSKLSGLLLVLYNTQKHLSVLCVCSSICLEFLFLKILQSSPFLKGHP